jgi:hypothetical protein
MVARVSTPDGADEIVGFRSLPSRLAPYVAVRPSIGRLIIALFLVTLAVMQATYWMLTL